MALAPREPSRSQGPPPRAPVFTLCLITPRWLDDVRFSSSFSLSAAGGRLHAARRTGAASDKAAPNWRRNPGGTLRRARWAARSRAWAGTGAATAGTRPSSPPSTPSSCSTAWCALPLACWPPLPALPPCHSLRMTFPASLPRCLSSAASPSLPWGLSKWRGSGKRAGAPRWSSATLLTPSWRMPPTRRPLASSWPAATAPLGPPRSASMRWEFRPLIPH